MANLLQLEEFTRTRSLFRLREREPSKSAVGSVERNLLHVFNSMTGASNASRILIRYWNPLPKSSVFVRELFSTTPLRNEYAVAITGRRRGCLVADKVRESDDAPH